MPSLAHKQKIEEIEREIKSRSMEWKTRKYYPVWLPKDNVFGQVDLVGFKKQTQNSRNSRAEVEGYEIEDSNGSLQKKRNLEKLQQLKVSFPPNVIVRICQLETNEDHKNKCFRKKKGLYF